MKIIKNYINGSEISISKETISVEDPSKGEKIADVVLSSEDDFNLAIRECQKYSRRMVKYNSFKKIKNFVKLQDIN